MYQTSYQIQAKAELERRKRLGLVEPPKPLWEPNPDKDGIPNPQRLAKESLADVICYGGAAGAGKTDLLLGLAVTEHKKAAIFRRVSPSLRGIIERSRDIYNPDRISHGKDSFNESLHRWSLNNGEKIIELESCQYEDDKKKQQGRDRDFFGFDEATEFTRTQIDYITTWCRSVDPNQRCRIVLTFNPPIDDEGLWICDYIRPWLAYLFPKAYQHPKPAKPGELRWYTTINGEEIECENGEPFEHEGELIKPKSRTFIPGRLEDNPFLINTDYKSRLQALDEPFRSMFLKGDFAAKSDADPLQVISAEKVILAQRRWRETTKPEVPMTVMGIDVARGGRDKTTFSKRYENWFDEIVKHPGSLTKDGPIVATLVTQEIEKDGEPSSINIDAIGVGSSPYDSLKEMYDFVNPINVGEKSTYRDKSGRYGMKNKRAEMYWRLREALDPIHGDNICLPPDNELLADLCAAKFKVVSGVIQIEEKDEIKKRIGRSPDLGECVLLTMLGGSKFIMGW